MQTIAEQIKKNICDYESSTGMTARNIEISESVLNCLLQEDKDSKYVRTIDGQVRFDVHGLGTFYCVHVNVFPFSDDSTMFINEEKKYDLESHGAEETQKPITRQILEFLSVYELDNGRRPNLIRIDPSILKYLIMENEDDYETFRADGNYYVLDGIEVEPAVFPSSNDFPISLCNEIKYALRIPRKNKVI